MSLFYYKDCCSFVQNRINDECFKLLIDLAKERKVEEVSGIILWIKGGVW